MSPSNFITSVIALLCYIHHNGTIEIKHVQIRIGIHFKYELDFFVLVSDEYMANHLAMSP